MFNDINTVGLDNMNDYYDASLKELRNNPVGHLVYASSSSVYRSNKKVLCPTEEKVEI